MSVSTEVQRTLVKSPPELWAELGSAEGLARHLGELGEIRVTKTEPETRVEWEADQVSGAVQLKQSGWGTRVTLSLTRELQVVDVEAEATPEDEVAEPDAALEAEAEPAGTAAPEAAAEDEVAEPEALPESEAIGDAPPKTEAEVDAVVAESEPAPESDVAREGGIAPVGGVAAEPIVIVEVRPEPEPVIESTEAVAASAPAGKLGFFARLFKRRPRAAIATTAPVDAEAEREPEPKQEIRALAQPEPVYPPEPPEPVEPVEPGETPEPTGTVEAAQTEAAEVEAEPAAELAEIEAQLQQESTELLTGVLDCLGAAHHRPFSRA